MRSSPRVLYFSAFSLSYSIRTKSWITCNKTLLHSYSLFCGGDETRGRLRFEGNLLFTHYGEIDAPDRYPVHEPRHTVNSWRTPQSMLHTYILVQSFDSIALLQKLVAPLAFLLPWISEFLVFIHNAPIMIHLLANDQQARPLCVYIHFQIIVIILRILLCISRQTAYIYMQLSRRSLPVCIYSCMHYFRMFFFRGNKQLFCDIECCVLPPPLCEGWYSIKEMRVTYWSCG